MNVWRRFTKYLEGCWPLIMGELALLSQIGLQGLVNQDGTREQRREIYRCDWLDWILT